MPFHRARADEEPGADLGVGEALTHEPDDLALLGGELLGRGDYAEVVREISRRLRAAADITDGGSVDARLRRHLAAHLSFLADHEDAALNLILRRGEATDLAWEAFEAVRHERTRSICALFGLDADEPELRLAMRGFNAACDEMSRQWLRDGRPMPVEALVDCFMTFLAGALRAAHGLAPAPALRQALEELEHGASHRQDMLQAQRT
ncbi:hypothetical protein [Streptomyces poonensis]|uniref:TetR family transcriptional regulator n=1 Tax=Streptomyces poonensis TaxID=68255 RepID=A0A918Q0C5_9ACTN|nr:hypothetical protein [Streptomyces poonensis]GGZ29537.1 hypothetical protein GCM10010365_57360 [Streptomyces poonensis]